MIMPPIAAPVRGCCKAIAVRRGIIEAVGWRILIIAITVTVIRRITIAVVIDRVRVAIAVIVIGRSERGANKSTRGKPDTGTTPAPTAVAPAPMTPTTMGKAAMEAEGTSLSGR
jgi:hypothetical protein